MSVFLLNTITGGTAAPQVSRGAKKHCQGYTHSAMRIIPHLGKNLPSERERAEEKQEQQ